MKFLDAPVGISHLDLMRDRGGRLNPARAGSEAEKSNTRRLHYAPGEISPAAALAIWDKILAEDASFFDTYPREGKWEGKTGPFDDEEKMETIREILTCSPEHLEKQAAQSRWSRYSVVRNSAAEVIGPPRPPESDTSPKLPAGDARTTREAMMSLGIRARAADGGSDLDKALDAARKRSFAGPPTCPPTPFPISAHDAIARSTFKACLAWAESGFPRIILGSHRLAASMMWIDATRTLANVSAPWPAFWITIPNNLVRYKGNRGEVEVTEGFVHVLPTGAVVANFGDSAGLFFQLLRPSLAALGQPDQIATDWAEHHADSEILTTLVARVDPPSATVTAAAEMLANLLLSVCVDMTAHRPSPRPARQPASSKRAPKNVGPMTTDYVIEKRAVYVDDPDAEDVNCVGAVRDHVRDPGGARGPTTQRIHRAHYQMQTCGPRSSLRRLQLHRAYRQGSDDAPIAVRPHVRRDRL